MIKDISLSPCFHPPSTYSHLQEVHSLNCKTKEGLFRNKELVIRLSPFSSFAIFSPHPPPLLMQAMQAMVNLIRDLKFGIKH